MCIKHEGGIRWDRMGSAQMQLDSFEVGQNSCPCYCNAGRQEWKGWWWAQGTWHSQVPLTDHVSSTGAYVECWSNKFGRLACKLQILKFPSPSAYVFFPKSMHLLVGDGLRYCLFSPRFGVQMSNLTRLAYLSVRWVKNNQLGILSGEM